jgi:GxxExxY protein
MKGKIMDATDSTLQDFTFLMPIELSKPIASVSQDEFHAIDKRMMRHAFAIHNQFGRMLDEVIYKQELAARCSADGMEVAREVMVRVRHDGFVKDYFIDLLVAGSTIVEAKTVRELLSAHQGQGINYLLLAGTHHGSLVNFRSSRVKRTFLSTRLTREQRCRFEVVEEGWPDDARHAGLKATVQGFCADVGLGLDLPLYRESTAQLGGCTRELVPILSGGRVLGHHEMVMVGAGVGLAVTGLSETGDCEEHLGRLLANTALEAISWINLRLGLIELRQVRKP